MAVSIAEVAANFAAMSDTELLELWAKGKNDFTSAAWRELRLEAEKRGLERPVQFDEGERQLNGTGGWLAVFQIFQVVTVLSAARGLVFSINEHYTEGIVVSVLMMGLLMVGLLLIIARHRAARRFWVGFYGLMAAMVVGIVVATSFTALPAAVGSLAWCVVWIRYWLVSTRVRVTFGYR
jgi:hypothetical protein